MTEKICPIVFAIYRVYERTTCLEIECAPACLDGHAPGTDDARGAQHL